MKLVWFERNKGFVSYASKYLVVFLADIDATRALSTLSCSQSEEARGPQLSKTMLVFMVRSLLILLSFNFLMPTLLLQRYPVIKFSPFSGNVL